MAPIAKYLTSPPTTIVVGKFGPAALAAALAHAGIPLPDAIVGGGLAAAGASAAVGRLSQVADLALFYQEARGISRHPARATGLR